MRYIFLTPRLVIMCYGVTNLEIMVVRYTVCYIRGCLRSLY